MSIDTNARWNTMLSNLEATTHTLHNVNIIHLLKELRNCGTRSVQDSGQRYTYASMEDIHGALENVIALANKTQDAPFVVFDSTQFVEVIENLCHGLNEAEDLLRRSSGCSTITTPSIHIHYDTLSECIKSYKLLNS